MYEGVRGDVVSRMTQLSSDKGHSLHDLLEHKKNHIRAFERNPAAP